MYIYITITLQGMNVGLNIAKFERPDARSVRYLHFHSTLYIKN